MKEIIWKEKQQQVKVTAGEAVLEGCLDIPQNADSLVLFVHGSGSSRHSKRNKYVARLLNEAGLATLLFDLFTRQEEQQDAVTGELRFDIGFLAERVVAVTHWLKEYNKTADMKLGYFGASTGAAAALVAASDLPDMVQAVVSRGGRPDMAVSCLDYVKAPTLLIVGEDDLQVLHLNKRAYESLNCERELVIIPGASHLFEEPGTLERAAEEACNWFIRYMLRHENLPARKIS